MVLLEMMKKQIVSQGVSDIKFLVSVGMSLFVYEIVDISQIY